MYSAKIREMREKYSCGSLSQDKADKKLQWVASYKELTSPCSGRNHRAFSQNLDQTMMKSGLHDLYRKQGCQGAVVKLSP